MGKRESPQTSESVKARIEYTYDLLGRRTEKKVKAGNLVVAWDTTAYEDVWQGEFFKETKTVKGEGSQAPDIVAAVYKNQLGRVVREGVFGPSNTEHLSYTTYDMLGNRRSYQNYLGKTSYWEYDYAGRVVKETNSLGQFAVTVYDLLGRKTHFYDFKANKNNAADSIRYSCDSLGRLLEQSTPFSQNSNGTKLNDTKTRYYYDGIGNVIRQITQCAADTAGGDNNWNDIHDARYHYDSRDRQTEALLFEKANNWHRTHYAYDSVGNKTEVWSGLVISNPDNLSSGSTGAVITKYEYNRYNQVIKMTDPIGRVESYVYDDTGVLERKQDRNGSVTLYTFDVLDRSVSETVTATSPNLGNITSEKTTEYYLSGGKKLESVTESCAGTAEVTLTTVYEYNSFGLLSKQTDPEGVVKSYSYDPNQNRTRFTLVKSGTQIDQHYIYDDLNRLWKVGQGSSVAAPVAEYLYDENGNRRQLIQGSIVTDYTYNRANLVTKIENKKGTAVASGWTYGYTLDGNQIKKTDLVNRVGTAERRTEYSYDRLGRLTREWDNGWNDISYTYDVRSNREKMTVKDSASNMVKSVTDYSYSPDNRLQTEEITERPGQAEERRVTACYQYDRNGNQVYREESRESARQEGTKGRIRFATENEADGTAILELREYNGFNRLVRVSRDAEETRYSDLPNRLRYSKTTQGITDSAAVMTVHCWDGQNVVAEMDGNGNVTSKYLRGIGLIARETPGQGLEYYLFNAHALDTETPEKEIMVSTGQEVTTQQANAGSLQYYSFDGCGNVVGLTDASGNLIKSYDYDAWGVEKNPDPNDTNIWRYAGEMYEKETGTYYLRARNMNPIIGRFLSADTHWNPNNMIYGDNPLKINEREDVLGLNTYTLVPDNTAIMQSGNLYVYAMNNPIMYKDPGGEFVITTTVLLIAGGAAIFGTIGGFVGNHIANQKGAMGWDKVGYIAGGAAIGAVGGGVLGAVAAPAATAAGFGGLSITAMQV